MTQPYDPRLKLIAEDIKKVLRKYDLAACAIALASDTHSKFVFEFPSWCGVQLENGGVRVRISSKDHSRATSSLHALFQLRDLCGRNFVILEHVSEQLLKTCRDAGMEVTHRPFQGFHPDMAP